MKWHNLGGEVRGSVGSGRRPAFALMNRAVLVNKGT
jgi:hypothetical protein